MERNLNMFRISILLFVFVTLVGNIYSLKKNTELSGFSQYLIHELNETDRKYYLGRYFENVGLPCGQARLGPRRRRLDRHEWKVEQVTAELAEACIARREDRHRKEMAGVRAQASEAMRRAQALPRVSVSGIKPVSGWAADESAQEQAEVVNSRTREVIKRLKP